MVKVQKTTGKVRLQFDFSQDEVDALKERAKLKGCPTVVQLVRKDLAKAVVLDDALAKGYQLVKESENGKKEVIVFIE